MPKISVLPGASTPLAGTELLVCVQGGVTVQCTVADVSTGGGGGYPAWVTPAAGQIQWANVSGSAHLVLKDNGQLDVIADADSQIIQDVAAAEKLGIHFGAVTTNQLLIKAVNPNSIRLEINTFGFVEMGVGGFNTLNIQGFNAITMQFATAFPASWGGPGVPTDLWVAIDRIANAVAGLLGGGIP